MRLSKQSLTKLSPLLNRLVPVQQPLLLAGNQLRHYTPKAGSNTSRNSSSSSNTRSRSSRDDDESEERWRQRRSELKTKLEGKTWSPAKRITRSSMESMRLLASEDPEYWTFARLCQRFGVSYEAVRRIMSSNYVPPKDIAKKQDERAIKKRIDRERTKWEHVDVPDEPATLEPPPSQSPWSGKGKGKGNGNGGASGSTRLR